MHVEGSRASYGRRDVEFIYCYYRTYRLKAVESLYEVKKEKRNIKTAKQTAILMLIMANVLNQTVQLQIQVVQYGDLLPNQNIIRELRLVCKCCVHKIKNQVV